jgi:transcriptional antiterminator RfaH
MPVLDWEPAVWPANLLETEPDARDEESPRWWALHVRPRTEKAVARRLRFRSFAYCLPQHDKRKSFQRRIVTSRLPLFPGYVFLYGDGAAHEYCASTREVVSCLKVVDQRLFIAQLRDVHRVIDAGLPVTAEEKLEVGMPARIIKGPLAGMSGSVLQNKRGLKFVLQVQFIQRAASIEIDGAMIEAI